MNRFITDFYFMSATKSITFIDGAEVYKHRKYNHYNYQNEYTAIVHFIRNMYKKMTPSFRGGFSENNNGVSPFSLKREIALSFLIKRAG